MSSDSSHMPLIRTPKCTVCGENTTLELPLKVLKELQDPDGRLIQDILPDWPAEKRELLISGTHPECWQKIFGSEESTNEL